MYNFLIKYVLTQVFSVLIVIMHNKQKHFIVKKKKITDFFTTNVPRTGFFAHKK